MKQKLRVFLTLLLCAVASVGWADDVYQKYSGEITEGEYIICYNVYAMKAEVSSNRLAYESSYNTSLDSHTVNNAAIVWKIEKDGDYYTIYNESVQMYAASTGTKNQATLKNTVTDNSLWTISGNSTYEFVNKANKAKSINANLRYNDNYGFACYSSSTGGSLTLYKKVENSDAITTITTIDATGITNTDIHEGTAAGQLSASVTANGTAVAGATVTWESSNEDCATIDANGIVTLVAAGTTTITATYAGVDNQYLPSSATYSLTVTDSTPFSGGDVTFDATQDKGTSPLFKNGVSFACDNGVLNNGTEYRLYKNSTTTFSVSEGVITQITFTGVSSNPASGFATQTGWTTDENDGTWTGNAQSVSFTASGAQVRATQIVVTVDMNATPDPIINTSDVNIAYDATIGSIEYTIGNPVAGTSLTAEITGGNEGNWLTLGEVGETSVPFTCSANDTTNPRTATVTLSYGEVTKTLTVTQSAAPLIYTTIPALFEAATSTETDVTVTFGNWVVSGVSTNGKNIFVTDNNGNGFVIYYGSDMSSTFSAGNILSGTVSCKLKKYNGFAELVNLNADDLTITDGGSVTTSSIAMADLAGVNTGALVSYENLTCSVDNNKYYLTDGTTTIQVYNSLYAFNALEAGKTYNITGVYQQYNTTKEVMPRSAADIVEVEVPVQTTITAGTLSHVAISSLYDGDMEDITLGDNVTEGTLVYFTLSVDEGYNLESVTVLNANNEEVTLTENQGSWSFTMPNSSVTINATATSSTPATGDQYSLFTGDLVEGDYIIYYDGKAMNTTVENDRLQYVEVTPSNNVITTENAAIVWHIAKSGEYWTIFNADADAYAASTGVKNKAQMLADGTDDKALWSVSGTETYDFVNKANAVANVNAYLRNNGTYGFACYAEGTGGALSLYKKVEAVAEDVTIDEADYVDEAYAPIEKYANVTFKRTLVEGWNGLVLPFDMTVDEAKTKFNATAVKDFTGVTYDSEKGATLNFSDATEITAGKPFMIKAAAGTEYTFDGVLLKSSTLQTISKQDGEAKYTMTGTYQKVDLTNENFVLIQGDKYYQHNTNKASSAKAFRAYFVNESTGEAASKGVNINFDGEATGIELVENGQFANNQNGVYNLQGQKVNNVQKGVYIVNGKKIVVK